MSDVFRFMTLRPPEAVELDTGNHVPIENPQSDFQKSLKNVYKTENALGMMIQLADRYMVTANYISNLDQLASPVKKFSKQIKGIKPLTLARLNTIIQQVFGQDAAQLIQTTPYKDDRRKLSDSLIAFIIVAKEINQIYEDLIRAVRLCGLLERVAAQDNRLNSEKAIEEALNQIVLLPEGIFPLPPTQSKTGLSAARVKEIKKEELAHKKVVEEAQQQFAQLKTAIDELVAVGASDFRSTADEGNTNVPAETAAKGEGFFSRLFSFVTGKRTNVVKVPTSISEHKPWILSEKAIKGLSPATKEVVKKFGISLETTSLPELTQILEKRLIDLSAEVYPAAEPTKLIKIGTTFHALPAPSVMDDAEVSIGTGASGCFRNIGVADLNVVRQEIQKYIAGEVAHIENVLKGEYKERNHRRTKRTEEIYELETETVEEIEKDLQSTERFELQNETNEVMKEDDRFSLDVTVKSNYIVDITANTKYATENSSEKASRAATNFTREVTDRAVSRVQEHVREKRIRTTIEEIEEKNFHRINNEQQPTDHVVGIYRWVDKIYKMQVYSYGERTMFEFIIPEPAAFLLHVLKNKKPKGITLDEPKPPTRGPKEFMWIHEKGEWGWVDIPTEPLRPHYIQWWNYQQWVAQYQVMNVEPPPPQYITKSYTYKSQQPSQNSKLIFEADNKSISITPGYKALMAYYFMGYATTSTETGKDIAIALGIGVGNGRVNYFYLKGRK